MDKQNIGKETLEIVARARWYNQWLFSFIKPHLGQRVLEVGCGIGIFTGMLLRENKQVVAIDIEHRYIDTVKSRLKSPHLVVVWGDIEKDKFSAQPGFFDTIVCLNVLEHIKDDTASLKNMFNHLTTRGKLILLVPAHQFLYGTLDQNLGHLRRYSRDGLSQIIEDAGFKIYELRFLNWLGVFGWFLNGKILRRDVLPSFQTGLFNFLARPPLLLEKIVPSPFGLSLFVVGVKV